MKIAVTAASGQLGLGSWFTQAYLENRAKETLTRSLRQTGKLRRMLWIAAHGEVFGTNLAGIYEDIRKGAFEVASDYREVTGRDHLSVAENINLYKLNL